MCLGSGRPGQDIFHIQLFAGNLEAGVDAAVGAADQNRPERITEERADLHLWVRPNLTLTIQQLINNEIALACYEDYENK
jgi:hypothetical protein